MRILGNLTDIFTVSFRKKWIPSESLNVSIQLEWKPTTRLDQQVMTSCIFSQLNLELNWFVGWLTFLLNTPTNQCVDFTDFRGYQRQFTSAFWEIIFNHFNNFFFFFFFEANNSQNMCNRAIRVSGRSRKYCAIFQVGWIIDYHQHRVDLDWPW